jgi:hypothetical protein
VLVFLYYFEFPGILVAFVCFIWGMCEERAKPHCRLRLGVVQKYVLPEAPTPHIPNLFAPHFSSTPVGNQSDFNFYTS